MRHKAHFFLPLAVLAAVVCAALWWAFLSPHMVFQLYDRENERVVLEVPAGPGDQLRLEIEHSFEHIPWYEYYTVTDDGAFNLDAIAVWMEEINSRFEQFRWITSASYMKGLQLNGEEIFDFRTLPDASRIRGDMIMKRGYLSIG